MFSQYKDTIEEHDLVFVWLTRDQIKPIYVENGKSLHTRYGDFDHSAMIGQKYGSQIASKKGYGFVYLLHPTPELWTVSLPHRTQIVYTPDASFISSKLSVLPGSVVIESGTGSGSFTHSLSRTVGSSGQVYSFEFHEVRCAQARDEFSAHKLQNVTLTHRDVCKNGFGTEKMEQCQKKANAIFLDLPAPWLAIPHLNESVCDSNGAKICCFSPCIEQVEKTLDSLQQHGWHSIELVEINHKKWESHQNMVRRVEDVLARLSDIKERKRRGIEEVRKGEKRNNSERDYGYNPFGKGQKVSQGDPNYEWTTISKEESELKSHTSFLTFATR